MGVTGRFIFEALILSHKFIVKKLIYLIKWKILRAFSKGLQLNLLKNY